MKKILIILISIFYTNSFACLNGETKVLKNGIIIYHDEDRTIPLGHDFQIKNSEKTIRELDSLYDLTKDIAYLSDKGYVLTILKKYDEALNLYFQIEKIKPGRYSTASNIGTIYELIGENQKAYDWIKKAISINPGSHEKSEWLHLKILEVKIKGEKFATSKFLINTDFGNNEIPNSNLDDDEIDELLVSIYYQLNERISFIKQEDKIIAVLLADLANLCMIQGDYYTAISIFGLSKKYGMNSALIDKRIDYANKKNIESLYKGFSELNNLQKLNKYHKSVILTISIVSSLIILFLIFLIIRKK